MMINMSSISSTTADSTLPSTTTVTTSTTTTSLTTSTTITSTISTNLTTLYEECLQNYSPSTCRLAEFIHVLAYFLLAASFFPQIIYIFNHRSKYVAGISYMWIIIRVLGLISLIVAHAFNWSSIFEFIAIISTIVVLVQILLYADNLHRQQQLILLGSSLLTWIIGGGIMLSIRKYESFLNIIAYLLLSVHMLPQILLNSLLRTAKALSKFSILFLALSDTLLFAYFYAIHGPYTYLVTSYYAFSFFLFIYLQIIVYTDSNAGLIVRSEHTVLAPGFDVLAGIDSNNAHSTGQEPTMFSIDEVEPTPDVADVIYQPVTSNKSYQLNAEQPLMKRTVWYLTLASIASIEIILTIMLVNRTWTPWIILVPISIPGIFGIFFLLRTRLSNLQTEYLRKFL